MLGSLSIYAFNHPNRGGDSEKKEVSTSQFDEGFEVGFCEVWKDVKGEYSICPNTPIPPIPTISQSYDSYKDGYKTGFKAGMKAANKN